LVNDKQEPIENLVTWVYEGGSFVPSAKLINGEKFSIINDYIGRPIQAYNEKGDVVWETDYDIYGDLRNLKGDKTFIPFRQLGQYEDVDTGLYYNRFRYYNPEAGGYISQDPIGLAGNNPNIYAYVSDANSWTDIFGLMPTPTSPGDVGAFKDLAGVVGDGLTPHHMPQDALGHMPREDGGCLVMPHDEHVKTRTYGAKGKATKKADLGRPFKDVLKDDIIDVKNIAGNKYDASLEKLIEFYENNGKLKKGELTLIQCK
jgi:RHS repeat-associated protein